ncbi:MAG: hypothetical protein ACE5D0_09135 [Fidelibacterota bacterium]
MRRILIVIIPLITFSLLYGAKLFHEQPFGAIVGEDLTLSVLPIVDSEIIEAKGYYRIKGNISYQELRLIQFGSTWQMNIDGNSLSQKGIEYCFIIHLANGAALAAPDDGNPFENPYFIPVKPPHSINNLRALEEPVFDEPISADVLILSPEPSSVVNQKDVIIAASLFNVPNFDSNSIQLLFNGKNVTQKTEISGGIITFIPINLEAGTQHVTITLAAEDGHKMTPTEWTFEIKRGSIIPSQLDYDGEVNSKISSDLVGGELLNVAELNFKGSANVEYAKLKINYRKTTRENPYLQPLNRSTFNVNFMKYLDVNFGDFYQSISAYTLDGRRVRGISVDLDLKFFQIQVIRGQLNRPVQHLNKIDGGYSLLGNETTIDSLTRPVFTLDRRGYTFERNISLTRFSIDLYNIQFGSHIMKVTDDVNSVNQYISKGNFFVDSTDVTYNDSLYNIPPGTYSYNDFLDAVDRENGTVVFPTNNWNGSKPQDNIVLGFDVGRVLDKDRLKFDLSWNMSLFNRDIWDGVMTRTQLDTALDDTLDGLIATTYDDNGIVSEGSMLIDTSSIFDPVAYKNLFIININMIPLLPIDPVSFGKNPISTIINMPSSAFHLRLSGNYRYNKFTIQYRQVGPEFVSLANPYLTNNIREFTLSNRLSLLNNKLMFNAMYKFQDNKILSTVKDPLITSSISFGITLMPGPDSPSYVVNFQSIGKNNSKEEFELVADELVDFREDTKSNNTFFSITYPISTGHLKHNLNINLNSLTNKDLLAGERKKGFFFQKSDSKTVSTALSTKYGIPLRTVFNVSRTIIQVPIQNESGLIYFNELAWTTINTKGSYSIWNNRLKITGGLSYLTNTGTTPIKMYGINSGVEYNIMAGMNALLTGNIQIRSTKEETAINTSGVLFSFRYNF